MIDKDKLNYEDLVSTIDLLADTINILIKNNIEKDKQIKSLDNRLIKIETLLKIKDIEDITSKEHKVIVEEARTIGGLDVNDIIKTIETKLSDKFLTTGNFNITEYNITTPTNTLQIELEVNNRMFMVFIDGKFIGPNNYTKDGNILHFNNSLNSGSRVTVVSLYEIILVDDNNLNNILKRIDDNKNEYIKDLAKYASGTKLIDDILKAIDSRLDNIKIDGSDIKIDDDSIVLSEDNNIPITQNIINIALGLNNVDCTELNRSLYNNTKNVNNSFMIYLLGENYKPIKNKTFKVLNSNNEILEELEFNTVNSGYNSNKCKLELPNDVKLLCTDIKGLEINNSSIDLDITEIINKEEHNGEFFQIWLIVDNLKGEDI